METSTLLSSHLKQYLNGANLTGVYLKELLDDITHKEATHQIGDLNTIALLTFHINYYIEALIKVLQGGSLEAKDSLSFTMKPLKDEEEWVTLRQNIYENIILFSDLVKTLSQENLKQVFVKDMYGTYERNIQGLLEHSHYHMGQIAILKKLIHSKV